jgi:hypothetical protein
MAGLVLAVVLIVGLAAFAWIERRAATGHPVRLPDLPRIELPLHGRAVLVGEAVIVVLSFLVIMIELAVVGLLQ